MKANCETKLTAFPAVLPRINERFHLTLAGSNNFYQIVKLKGKILLSLLENVVLSTKSHSEGVALSDRAYSLLMEVSSLKVTYVFI